MTTCDRSSLVRRTSRRRWLPRRTLTLALGFALLLLTALTTACEPVPNRVALAGDSISWNAWEAGEFATYDVDGKLVPGGQAYHVQPRVEQDVNGVTTSPAVLVLAFGSNEIGNGWDLSDYASWERITNTPDNNGAGIDACVVWVKPWNIAPTMPLGSARHVHMNSARATIDHLVAQNPGERVAVDWRPVVEANPGLLASDGVHLDEAGADEYAALIQAGVNQCGAL